MKLASLPSDGTNSLSVGATISPSFTASGRWRLYYEEDVFRAQVREVARLCDRWASILERHRELLIGPQDVELRFAEPDVAEPDVAELDVVVLEDAEPDAAARDRDAA